MKGCMVLPLLIAALISIGYVNGSPARNKDAVKELTKELLARLADDIPVATNEVRHESNNVERDQSELEKWLSSSDGMKLTDNRKRYEYVDFPRAIEQMQHILEMKNRDTDKDVRLVGGSKPSEGRLEIRYDGVWQTVCDDFWDVWATSVVCRELGFPITRPPRFYSEQQEKFGKPVKPIFTDFMYCNGDEASLGDCQNYGGGQECAHNEDIIVFCDSVAA